MKLILRRTGKSGNLLKISKKEISAFLKVVNYIMKDFNYDEDDKRWSVPTKWGIFEISVDEDEGNNHYWIYVRFYGTNEEFKNLKQNFYPFQHNTSGKWNIHSCDPLTCVYELQSKLEQLEVKFNEY
jgi:hypothetical protein